MPFTPLQVRVEPQPFAAVRVQVERKDIASVVADLYAQVYAWLTSQAIAVSGAPLIRYLVVDPGSARVDIQVGFPIAVPLVPGAGPVEVGEIPGGTYVIAVHRGPHDTLVTTTAMLLDWGRANAVAWQTREAESGTHWAGRVEHYLRGPPAESDPRNWHTEIALLRA